MSRRSEGQKHIFHKKLLYTYLLQKAWNTYLLQKVKINYFIAQITMSFSAYVKQSY